MGIFSSFLQQDYQNTIKTFRFLFPQVKKTIKTQLPLLKLLQYMLNYGLIFS